MSAENLRKCLDRDIEALVSFSQASSHQDDASILSCHFLTQFVELLSGPVPLLLAIHRGVNDVRPGRREAVQLHRETPGMTGVADQRRGSSKRRPEQPRAKPEAEASTEHGGQLLTMQQYHVGHPEDPPGDQAAHAGEQRLNTDHQDGTGLGAGKAPANRSQNHFEMLQGTMKLEEPPGPPREPQSALNSS